MNYRNIYQILFAATLFFTIFIKPAFSIVLKAEMSLVKSVDRAEVLAGSTVTYAFTVTNLGNLELTSVTINDLKCGGITFDKFLNGDNDSDFEPGEVWVYKCSATINQTTINTATASAIVPFLEDTIDSKPSSVTVTVIVPTATPTTTPVITVEPKATTVPIPCQKINNQPAQISLDRAASSMNTVASRLSKRVLKLSRDKRSRQFARAAAAQSNALYVAIWVEAWKNISSEASQCSVDANQLSLCVKTSFVAQKTLIRSHFDEIDALIIKMANLFKREFPRRVPYANHLVRSSARFKAIAATMLQSVPDESVSCN